MNPGRASVPRAGGARGPRANRRRAALRLGGAAAAAVMALGVAARLRDARDARPWAVLAPVLARRAPPGLVAAARPEAAGRSGVTGVVPLPGGDADPGAAYDVLKVLPAADRPAWVVLPAGDDRAARLLAGGALAPAPAPAGPLALYRWRWGAPDPGPRLAGWFVADDLDAGDPRAEAAHGVRWRDSGPATARVLADGTARAAIGDAGRALGRGVEGVLRADAGRAAVVVARIWSPAPATLAWRLGSRGDGSRIPLAGEPNRFQTVVFALRAAAAVSAAEPFTLRLESGPAPVELAHLWLLQERRAGGAAVTGR